MSKLPEIGAPYTKADVNQMKEEIAREFGVQLGANSSSKQNGQVGGEITKRLIRMAKQTKS